MTDDDTIDRENDAPESEEAPLDDKSSEAPDIGATAQPARRKGFWFLALLTGFFIAISAGGLGGFAAHEYLKTPTPDLSQLEQDIAALQETVQAQAAQVKQIEGRSKSAAAKTARDIDSLNDKWQSGLRELDDKVEAIEIPVAPPANVMISPEVSSDDTQEREAPLETIIDPRPELLAVIDDLRVVVESDVLAIKDRLDRLEAQPVQTASDEIPETTGQEDFPVDEIFEDLKRLDAPGSAQNWWDKILQKHVSLKRTDRLRAEGLVRDIEAAIVIGDWKAAEALATGLPEPSRTTVQEWIARARR